MKESPICCSDPSPQAGALTLRSLVFTAALVVAGAFAWFVWPTPYRVNSEGIPTREHRIFGERQALLRDEWVPVYLFPTEDD